MRKKKVVIAFMAMLVFIMIWPSLLSQMDVDVKVSAAPSLSTKTKKIKPAQTFVLKVRGNKRKPIYSSSKKSILTVNSKGYVRGRKAGTAYVIVKVDKKVLRCKVTVLKKYSLSQMHKKVDQYIAKHLVQAVCFSGEDFIKKDGKYYYTIRYQGGKDANILLGDLVVDPYTGVGIFCSMWDTKEVWHLL